MSTGSTRSPARTIAAGTDQMFRRFCLILGRPEVADDPDFVDNNLRSQNRARLTQIINEELSKKDMNTWVEDLNKQGIPCGPIYTVDRVFSDPQVLHLGMLLEMQHPQLGAADALYRLGRYAEARKVYRAVAAAKETSVLGSPLMARVLPDKVRS